MNTSAEKNSIASLAQRLVLRMRQLVPCVVAYSGGVDSAVVAAAVVRAERAGGAAGAELARTDKQAAGGSGPQGGARSLAVTALSPAVPASQRAIAQRVAREIEIEHLWVDTAELARQEYARNDSQRCYFCKQTLYASLRPLALQRGGLPLVSGTNADDLGDYRPGIDAGRAVGVATPLADLGITKAEVRQIAALWGLSVAELPAAPCLASRVAYGVEVTAERLRMIELAEQWLSEQGFSPLRVRLLAGELAKIEVDLASLPRLVSPPLVARVHSRLREIGFRGVSVDLAGFRSGSLNQLFQITAPRQATAEPATPPSAAAPLAETRPR